MNAAAIAHAVAGGLREDYFITPAGQVYLRQLGGNAVYATVGARLWSQSVGLVSRVGENYPADWLETIAARGIDAAGVAAVPAWLDTRTFYAYRSLEVREDTDPAAHFTRLGRPLPAELEGYATSTEGQESRTEYGPLAVRAEEVPERCLRVRGFHLAPYDYLVHRRLPARLRAHGVRVLTCDPSVRYMRPDFATEVRDLLGAVDAFLPSEMEARGFLPNLGPDLWPATEAFAAMGPRCVVIKLGARGQFVFDAAHGRRWHVPAYPAEVRDVTGAGDAYCGGFMVGLEQTGDPVEAALRGTVAASMVVEGIGALYALDAPAGEAERRLARWRGEVKRM